MNIPIFLFIIFASSVFSIFLYIFISKSKYLAENNFKEDVKKEDKIIQIIETHNGLIALYSDGSIWRCTVYADSKKCSDDWICMYDENNLQD